MNRIDRLFGILLLLQSKRKIRAEDIARKFEVTERTVYRDMAALMELGIPISAQTGEGYSLMDGYFLPPLIFTPEEAQALFLGIKMLESSGNLSKASADARTKLQTALSPRLLKQITPLVEAIEFFSEKGRYDLSNPHLRLFLQAIREKRCIYLGYLAWGNESKTERIVEPFSLTFGNGAWYLNAFCRLRQDIRSFRFDRIENLRLLDESFSADHEPKANPAPQQHVSVRFPQALLRRVYERQHYAFVSEEEIDADRIFHYQVHKLSEIRSWLLGWGADVEILTPLELRQSIREEAEKWLRRY